MRSSWSVNMLYSPEIQVDSPEYFSFAGDLFTNWICHALSKLTTEFKQRIEISYDNGRIVVNNGVILCDLFVWESLLLQEFHAFSRLVTCHSDSIFGRRHTLPSLWLESCLVCFLAGEVTKDRDGGSRRSSFWGGAKSGTFSKHVPLGLKLFPQLTD